MIMVELIISAVAVVINAYIIYKMIQSHTRVTRLERSLKSSQQYDWLCSAGMHETATTFNEWGQVMERQAKQHDYCFQIPNIKWYV